MAFLLGLLQNLLANWIGSVVVIGLLMATMLALWAKSKEHWSWPLTVIAVLVIFACLVVFYAPITWWLEARSTTKSTEDIVSDWLKQTSYSTQHFPPREGEVFHLRVTTASQLVIDVLQRKGQEGYIAIQGLITISGKHREILSRMNDRQKERFWRAIKLDILKFGIQYVLTPRGENPSIMLEQIIVYDRRMLLPTFAEHIFSVERALDIIMQNIIALEDNH